MAQYLSWDFLTKVCTKVLHKLRREIPSPEIDIVLIIRNRGTDEQMVTGTLMVGSEYPIFLKETIARLATEATLLQRRLISRDTGGTVSVEDMKKSKPS